MIWVEATAAVRPAASAKGTVRPSAMPMTTSRTFSDPEKWASTWGVAGIGLCSSGLVNGGGEFWVRGKGWGLPLFGLPLGKGDKGPETRGAGRCVAVDARGVALSGRR